MTHTGVGTSLRPASLVAAGTRRRSARNHPDLGGTMNTRTIAVIALIIAVIIALILIF
jgi:hypothetical protein